MRPTPTTSRERSEIKIWSAVIKRYNSVLINEGRNPRFRLEDRRIGPAQSVIWAYWCAKRSLAETSYNRAYYSTEQPELKFGGVARHLFLKFNFEIRAFSVCIKTTLFNSPIIIV